MNHEVFITCALIEAGDSTEESNLVTVTPEEITKRGGGLERPQLELFF